MHFPENSCPLVFRTQAFAIVVQAHYSDSEIALKLILLCNNFGQERAQLVLSPKGIKAPPNALQTGFKQQRTTQ